MLIRPRPLILREVHQSSLFSESWELKQMCFLSTIIMGFDMSMETRSFDPL